MKTKKVQILQIGKYNLAEKLEIPEELNWEFIPSNQFNIMRIMQPPKVRALWIKERDFQLKMQKWAKQLNRILLRSNKKCVTSISRQQLLEVKKRRGLYVPKTGKMRLVLKDLKPSKKQYQGVVVTDTLDISNKEQLPQFIEPYTFLVDQSLSIDNLEKNLYVQLMPQTIDVNNPDLLMNQLIYGLFRGQSGIRHGVHKIEVSPDFTGSVDYTGQATLNLQGHYGEEFQPLLFWKTNMFVDMGKKIEFWLEYALEGDCDIQLHIYELIPGASAISQNAKIYSQEDMQQSNCLLDIDTKERSTSIYVSLWAKGSGTIQVGNFHTRFSRLGLGNFLLGGGKFHDQQNHHEFIYYFEPGDLKPPLNVYFSGFRSLEGFEGYFMMKRQGAPFLLFSDPRLVGGSFYIGSEEYESKIKDTIQYYLDLLGFDNSQLVLSGMSMGTFGALYYASDLMPAFVICGKTIVNLGRIAENTRKKYNKFVTITDVLLIKQGSSTEEARQKFNQRFWDKFNSADFSNTRFYHAPLIHEDYDDLAIPTLNQNLMNRPGMISGKGIPGRHLDNARLVNNWVMNQYKRIMIDYYGRSYD